jgi:predicted GNAT superfamily acetyltransferase
LSVSGSASTLLKSGAAARRWCRLYADLFDRAAEAGHDRIVCEVNRQPPNPASDAFHAALGFAEVGSANIHTGSRTVRTL